MIDSTSTSSGCAAAAARSTSKYGRPLRAVKLLPTNSSRVGGAGPAMQSAARGLAPRVGLGGHLLRRLALRQRVLDFALASRNRRRALAGRLGDAGAQRFHEIDHL